MDSSLRQAASGKHRQHSDTKPIVFLTSGTRGDVQPVALLAHGLQDAGHAVRLAAPSQFQNLVEAHSLPFTTLEGNPSDLLTIPGRQSALTFNDNPLRGIKSALEYLNAARPVYAQMVENGWRAAQGASALILGLPTIWGTSIAEALEIPCFGAFLQPVSPTGDFPSPLLPSTLRAGRGMNRLTYRLIAQSIYLPWRGVLNQWRKKSLGLRPLPVIHNFFEHLDAILYGFSDIVVPHPQDWPVNQIVTGYWSLPVNQAYTPPPTLQAFLDQSMSPPGKPFYFGFGSPGMHAPVALMQLLFEAVKRTNIRAVIAAPGKMAAKAPTADVFILRENVPHDWLFPRMAGIVHHGGAGTTASALRAGVPSLGAPLAVDQFFWAGQMHRLGVSPRVIPQRALTVENLTNALEEMKTEKIKATAHQLGERLGAEDGVARALEALEKLLETETG